MLVQELYIFDEWAPSAYSEDFDNTGLLVGNPMTNAMVFNFLRYNRGSFRGSY